MIEDIIVKVLNNTNNTHHPSPSSLPASPVLQNNSSENKDIQTESALTLWIDLPNIFPWRRCVQEYNNLLTVLDCDKVFSLWIFIKTKQYFQNIFRI